MENEREESMPDEGFQYQAALQDFRRARRRASLEQLVSFLMGKSSELLSYEDVRRKLKVTGSSGQKLEEIPLDAIVGSVGRYKDFTRSFLPRRDSEKYRWARIEARPSRRPWRAPTGFRVKSGWRVFRFTDWKRKLTRR